LNDGFGFPVNGEDYGSPGFLDVEHNPPSSCLYSMFRHPLGTAAGHGDLPSRASAGVTRRRYGLPTDSMAGALATPFTVMTTG
jgi:hypothetical protein